MTLHLTSQQIGDRLEQQLALLHVRYHADGLALMWKNGTEAIPVTKPWNNVTEWVPQDGRPDFEGMLYGSARHVVFDAKHCQEATYYHDTKRRAHQLIDIWDAYESGAVAGILVVNTVAGAGFWLMPTSEWSAGQFVPRRLALAREVPAHPAFPDIYQPDWLRVAK